MRLLLSRAAGRIIPGVYAALAAAAAAAQQAGKPLQDADIAAMARAGLPDSTIMLAIEANTSEFDVSPQQLIELRKQHVSDPVIQSMLAAAARKRGSAPASASSAPGTTGGTSPAPPPSTHARARFPVEFSAQRFIAHGADSVPGGTVYVGGGRLRLETQQQILLVDPVTLTGYAWHADEPVRVIPRFEGVRGVPNRAGLSRYLLPVYPDRLCAEWINVTCQRLGADSVQGRSAVKWQVTQSYDDDSTGTVLVWVDERLHLVSRVQMGQYTEELRNVIEQPQPPGLFQPPAH